MEESSNLYMIDEAYEFSAPRFYDFLCEETEEEVRTAELWFDSARAYAPSRAFAYPSLLDLMLICFEKIIEIRIVVWGFLEISWIIVDYGVADSGWFNFWIVLPLFS